jgi:hypothetical protein
MRVSELIDLLQRHPFDAEVELAVVFPTDDDQDEITVDRFPVDSEMPWVDDDSDEVVIWLIGGDDDDLDAFEHAIEHMNDDDDDATKPSSGAHSHGPDGHTHDHGDPGHTH